MNKKTISPRFKPIFKGTRIFIITLGCPKNIVDSEILAFLLERSGYRVTKDPGTAEAVILNTCGFLKEAKDEAYEEIEKVLEAKRRGDIKFVAVGGCLYQRPSNTLKDDFPEVDLFFGHDDIPKFPHILMGKVKPKLRMPPLFLGNGSYRRFFTPPHYAYLKISEGCNRKCSFCTIPSIRGFLRSRDIPSLIEEARILSQRGVKELILIAQDLTQYGRDLGNKDLLIPLIRELNEIKEIKWIRLLYLHPAGINSEFISVLKESEKVVPYLEIPIQHISQSILRSMRRAGGEKAIKRAIGMVRKEIPKAFIRTEVMVGFPGEREKDFNELMRYLEEEHFERIGIFKFSPEPGTLAAHMPEKVSNEVIEERFDLVSTLAYELMSDAQERLKGETLEVLIDKIEDGKAIGRTYYDSPEIDFTVHVTDTDFIKPGGFLISRILDVDGLDLNATIVSNWE